MELFLVVGFFAALAVAAPRFGHDSRIGLRSREQELAAAGVRWPGWKNPLECGAR